ncbi:MAG: alanine racemase [Traorella sp.]
MYYRDTYAKIDCDAIFHNIKLIQNQSNKALIAILKANGYGHSDYYVAKTAMKAGCIMVAVSSLDEALALRRQGFYDQILVLGHIRPWDIETAIEHHITVSVVSLDWLKEIINSQKDLKGLLFHIKIDTGMNRIGIRLLNEVKESIQLIEKHHGIVEGIFTHYACADSDSLVMCEQQFEKFKEIVLNCNYSFKWIHCENSAAIFSFPDTFTNAARCGLVMYGISPLEEKTDLIPALSLISHLVCVKKIKKGESVGYGATYVADEDCIIGTLPIGYADGFLRANQNRYLYCAGGWIQVVGRICMDQCMVKLDKEYVVGTPVEIISKNNPVTKMAKELNTIPYEILCLLSDRIPRKIYMNHKQIAIINNRLHEF